jgi:hypothetical protein
MTVNMMNPMYFISQNSSSCAQYWFIRTGTKDTDTAHTIFGNLATILENRGKTVNASLYWDAGHGVNLDPEVFIAWSSQITHYSIISGQLRPMLRASAFCNVTVLPGWTWYFFVQSAGGSGAHTYQWYEGTTLLQGQSSMVIALTKNTPGTYTFYCGVTDSEGTTANSNNVTLTVMG